MQVLVAVRNRSKNHQELGNRTLNLVVDVDPEGTVGNIAEELSKKLGASDLYFKVILCGRVLDKDTVVGSLLLGPETSLAALLLDAADNGEASKSETAKNGSKNGAASFQVFCKNCDDGVKQGKLRVYCSQCSSSSVLIKQDPAGWNDVLASSKLRADCDDCKAEVFVRFCFKCVECGEIAVPLTHVRGVARDSDCCICGEPVSGVVVDLGCHHTMCLQCFIAYMSTSLKQQHFILKPPYGYTLSCPIYNCDACVADPHHFYLLGKQKYETYKTLAAEKFVTLEEGGLFCPNPKCGAAFIWEREAENQPKVYCPECRRVFCGDCRQEKCVCGEKDASMATIQTTCKNCPTCGAPTERNGGCTHIHCIHCNAHWCFLCVKRWSEDCQWNHWFD